MAHGQRGEHSQYSHTEPWRDNSSGSSFTPSPSPSLVSSSNKGCGSSSMEVTGAILGGRKYFSPCGTALEGRWVLSLLSCLLDIRVASHIPLTSQELFMGVKLFIDRVKA